MSKALIFRAEIDIGSNILLLLGDVHTVACGLQSKGYSSSMHPGDFIDSLREGTKFLLCFIMESC